MENKSIVKLISHRGNINGKIENYENEPSYVDLAISEGYDVEIDIWVVDGIIYLGHDKPQYCVAPYWFSHRVKKLWIHCKNIDALLLLKTHNSLYNYFWHEQDEFTLTSHNYIWAYPRPIAIKNSIAVLPEINNTNITECIGICSDFIENYRK
jgi:hypothetical protein